ncbi:PLD nuclease N-terminal domain-containing protein [Actinomadura sp. NPDC047616]|uniref:PLD nuclease N-terminal domain-containing protein n=1 Tax=Actinomadura sp. NPDC047616 TaxID=3155914 RepID=UPI0033E9E6B4
MDEGPQGGAAPAVIPRARRNLARWMCGGAVTSRAGHDDRTTIMDYPLLNAFLTMLWLFLLALWFLLLFRVITDVFRDDSLNGWAKAGWTIFVIVLPVVGVLTYLIVRGRGMGDREIASMRAREAQYQAAMGGRAASQAEELGRLAALKDHGDLTAEEYQRAKTKVLAG